MSTIQDVVSALGFAKPIPFVRQSSRASCGAACLAMVCRYHGRFVSLIEMVDATNCGRDGATAQDIVEAGRRHGFSARAVSVSAKDVSALPLGAILHWRGSHFVVHAGISKGRHVLVDPARGRLEVSHEEVATAFSGVAILLTPSESFQKRHRATDWRTIRQYVDELWPARKLVAGVIACSIAISVVGLIPPWVTRRLVDDVIPRANSERVLPLAIGLLALALSQAAFFLGRSVSLLYLRARLDQRLTKRFVEHLFALPMDFLRRRSTGDLLISYGANVTAKDSLTTSLISLALDILVAILYSIILVVVSPILAVVTIGFAALQMGLLVFWRQRQRRLIDDSLAARSEDQGFLLQMLASIETLKAMGAESEAVKRWAALFSRTVAATVRSSYFEAWLGSGSNLLRTMSALTLLLVGAWQVIGSQMTLGAMFAAVAIANTALGPLLSVAGAAGQFQALAGYSDRVADITSRPGERSGPPARGESLTGAIRLERVSFGYGQDALAVDEVSLEIQAGEFVSIVGASGSGKSTLARLIGTLYAPKSGTVVFDGLDAKQLDVRSIRRQVGFVGQQLQLLPGTVRFNIGLGLPGAELHAIIAAARAAVIHNDIDRLPLGYGSILGDQGAGLSGGQLQRLAIARALVSKPRLLILDEATGQLDERTEQAVIDQLSLLRCTRVLVSHRLAVAHRVDRVIVLRHGRVVETGSAIELLRTNGEFARLFGREVDRVGTVAV